MANSDDIGQLISRVGLKDRRAFQELYQRTSSKLFGITLRVLGNRNDAEDALQEIYVKIWSKADSFSKGKSSGIAWLSVIARNQAIDLLRSRKGSEDIDDHLDLSDDKPSPEMVTLSNENSLPS